MSAGYADSAGNATSATSATKWSTARTISLSGDLSGSVSLDGSANVTLTASVYDDSHTHAWTRNPGEHKEAASGTTGSSPNEGMLYPSGLYMTQNYTDPNTPCTYGNIINIAGAGTGQLFCEWKGTDSTSGGLWYRSHRDTTGGGWGAWRQVWCSGDSVTGAVWNDYAEYRESDCQEFGRVLTENGDDTLSISTKRLQPFAGVSSDTWGFCQGETEKAKIPIAVAGRVLVYPYRNRNEYKPGDVVCAAPNGTVDIMTPQEEMMYPSRIVGTVSCVPDYEEWGSGDRPAVKVNGRIWIKVY